MTTLPSDPALHMEVGRLDGRLSAMETRMDRHEVEMRAQLSSMDVKLDSIQTTLAERGGSLRWNYLTWKWAMSLLAVGGAWFGGIHFWGK
jgi:hypothetical protein